MAVVQLESGREDLNLRPLAPHASALAGLRHAPRQGRIIVSFYESGNTEKDAHDGFLKVRANMHFARGFSRTVS